MSYWPQLAAIILLHNVVLLCFYYFHNELDNACSIVLSCAHRTQLLLLFVICRRCLLFSEMKLSDKNRKEVFFFICEIKFFSAVMLPLPDNERPIMTKNSMKRLMGNWGGSNASSVGLNPGFIPSP